jgi:YD repeat-containing protein
MDLAGPRAASSARVGARALGRGVPRRWPASTLHDEATMMRGRSIPHRSLASVAAAALLAGVLTLLSASWPGVGAAATIQYLYDANGRLVAVIDDPGATGDVAIYRYDAVGNLLSIDRGPATDLNVIAAPPSATPGSNVTIVGTGFSTTPSQNTVTFNGVAGTVVSATATQLVVTVPGSATTGNIVVTTPTATDTGPSLTILTPLAVSSFTPAIGAPGTSVSVSGTSFQTGVANNRVSFNLKRAVLSSATSTALGTTVPTGATSGRLTIALCREPVDDRPRRVRFP